MYLKRSGFRILILKDTSVLANAEASLFENQFGFSIIILIMRIVLMDNEDLTTYFDEQLFLPDLKAITKDDLLKEIVDQFVTIKYLKNSDIVLEMLRQREVLGSTGIGKGIAIPHGRSTSASDIMIAFGKSKTGVDYESIDGKPVNLVFMIIAPPQDENNRYLPILGKMVEILSKAKSRNKLMAAESFEEFIDVILKG